MEEEIEDIIGDVKYTDSQKSVATSNVYSMDFDSSSDKNNSSGKETYVLELDDSEDSESYGDKSVIDRKEKVNNKTDVDTQYDITKINKEACTSLQSCSIVQEIYTQTSKTIFELAQTDVNKESLETQTSFVSITENRTYEYRIEVSNSKNGLEHVNKIKEAKNDDRVLSNTLEDESSKFPESDIETVKSDDISEVSSEDRIINIIDAESNDNFPSDENRRQYDNTSEESIESDIEEDYLMETKRRIEIDNQSDSSDFPKSVDNDIEDLYTKLSQSIDLHTVERNSEPDRRFNTLTPLTEESTVKNNSLVDVTPDIINIVNVETDKDVVFTNSCGGKIKLLPREEIKPEFKLPPIQNRSCPNSPHLNFLFSVHPSNILNKAGTLPCLYEAHGEKKSDRWEIGTKDLASGESPLISGKSGPAKSKDIHLPPIHLEGYVINSKISKTDSQLSNTMQISRNQSNTRQDAISINEKIGELKTYSKEARLSTCSRYASNASGSNSRSRSPSCGSPHESRLCDAAERGCEALCAELLRRLHSNSWFEVADTLEEIPKVLEKFWSVIAEHRIADLIRQVSAHVESPRTQVARSACNALASVLKNTNYTKKPDFYEAVTLLLTKTGSFSLPVRRAANMALDGIVCGADLTNSVTALCIHGVGHKSALVRCAAARLLVVACALGGCGRQLLRARPASAAAARRHALRALAGLLHDKSTDARKYAERLYSMLRPLPNFEAFYLTDVEVELATRQMKKYDRTLLCGEAKETR